MFPCPNCKTFGTLGAVQAVAEAADLWLNDRKSGSKRVTVGIFLFGFCSWKVSQGFLESTKTQSDSKIQAASLFFVVRSFEFELISYHDRS